MTVTTSTLTHTTPPTGDRCVERQLAVALPYGPYAPHIARHIAARWLADEADPPSRRRDAVLIVSELVTNAVRHTRQPCTLTLTLRGNELDIAVADHSEMLPDTPTTRGEHGGYGIALVQGLGGRIKVVPELGGKTVHAALDVTSLNQPAAHASRACLNPGTSPRDYGKAAPPG